MRNAPKFYAKYVHSALTVSESKTEVTGAQGYRSALATSQKYALPLYFESQIESDAGHARIGIATTKCELNGPVGIDQHGYSYGSKNGYGFHGSKRVRMGERYSKHDILGVYLFRTKKGLALEFFVNGDRVGRQFGEISEGEYWPAVSLYGGCTVRLNTGPYFAYETKIRSWAEQPQNQLAGKAASPAREKRPRP